MTIGQVLFLQKDGQPYVEPNVNIGVPNGKIAFFQSGSGFTTPVSVYQDGGLTTLWTQPIQANAAGILPPIYLSPLVVYTNNAIGVRIMTAGGAIVRQLDPYPIPYCVTSGSQAIQIANPTTGEITIGPPSSGVALTLNALQNGAGLLIVGPNNPVLFGGGPDIPLMIINNAGLTGSQTAIFTATNVPGFNTVRPFRWIPIQCDGVLYYMVAFSH